MLANKVRNKVRLDGHYEVERLGVGTDYVWIPGEEFVEEWRAEALLHPWEAEDRRQRREQRRNPERQYWLELCAL